jgi:beta-lactamase class A
MNSAVAEPEIASDDQEKQRPRVKKSKKLPPRRRLLGYAALVGVSAVLLGAGGAAITTGAPWLATNSHEKTSVVVPPSPPPIKMSMPLEQLRAKLEQVSTLPNLHAGVFVCDQATGRYVDMNGHEGLPAASMIKLPIFVALLNAIDQGRVKPDDMLEVKQEDVTGGSGWLQWRPLGTRISVKDTADLMIIVSDNTATNMIIDLLGGKEPLSQQFAQWGLASTRINNMLGDFDGTNTTSPYDLVYLLARVDRGEIINPESRKWMEHTMSRTRIRTLLPPGLGAGAKIAHKTGDIACMVGDAGEVTLPNGGKYFVSVQVQRPSNDRRANLLIRSLSKMIYQCFSSSTSDGSEVALVPLESLRGAPSVRSHRRRHHRS